MSNMLQVMNTLIQQNMCMMQAMQTTQKERDSVRNFSVMPDLTKTVGYFNGQHSESKQWLETERDSVRNFSVMPDLTKTVGYFNGQHSESKQWLETIESMMTLHNWPEEFTFETARSHLKGSSLDWYKSRMHIIKDWNSFVTEFRKTWITELMGLWSKDLCNTMITREHGDLDELLNDILLGERIHTSRQSRIKDTRVEFNKQSKILE
ncbi:hypothetical protein QE152_g16000 [Popillia japonica]|uniref:Retrotransposon gag domain-containing protein n=1 Tax=Popillia japonica TaxID=7064 RepID=A0AAW1L6K0_POPJA